MKGVDAWAERLGKREMPVLSGVITELNELTGSDDAEVNQLAEVILKDANLTSQVLRIANSVGYNPSNYEINTVSKAIVLIGFTGVRAICISVMMIDSLLSSQPRERLLEKMALGFMGAVQARELVGDVGHDIKEQVFIAGLLFNIGEMAFWCSGGETAAQLDDLLGDNGVTSREATEELLGCSFQDISMSLAQSWHLGETLEESLNPGRDPSAKVQAVCLGEEISRAALIGWDAQEMEDVLYKVSRFTGKSYLECKERIEATAETVAEVALTYGAPQVCPKVPTRRQQEKKQQDLVARQPIKADHEIQLNVLRDLSNAVIDKLDVNAIFQMVLEGLHRGIGLERVVLAFVQKDQLAAKFLLGEGTKNWRERFQFPVGKYDQNIFSHTIQIGQPQWFTKEMLKTHKHLYPPELVKVVGKSPAFVSGVFIGPRCVAMFYADRWNLGGNLQEDQFKSFCHFMMQTETSLRAISQRQVRNAPAR